MAGSTAWFSLRRTWKKSLRLDLQESCGNDQKSGHIIGIRLLKAVHIGQVLVGDHGQRDRGDVQFGLFYQVEQQIQRPFIDGDADLIIGMRTEHILHGDAIISAGSRSLRWPPQPVWMPRV